MKETKEKNLKHLQLPKRKKVHHHNKFVNKSIAFFNFIVRHPFQFFVNIMMTIIVFPGPLIALLSYSIFILYTYRVNPIPIDGEDLNFGLTTNDKFWAIMAMVMLSIIIFVLMIYFIKQIFSHDTYTPEELSDHAIEKHEQQQPKKTKEKKHTFLKHEHFKSKKDLVLPTLNNPKPKAGSTEPKPKEDWGSKTKINLTKFGQHNKTKTSEIKINPKTTTPTGMSNDKNLEPTKPLGPTTPLRTPPTTRPAGPTTPLRTPPTTRPAGPTTPLRTPPTTNSTNPTTPIQKSNNNVINKDINKKGDK